MKFLVSGFNDLKAGLDAWRIWHLIGSGDLRRRYSRSKLGQFWLTLSTGISILIMSAVWAVLFKQPLANMLPYMAVSIIIWQFFAGIMSDAVNVFVSSNHLLLSQKMPCSIVVIASVYRNFLTLLHNLIIIPVVFLVFWVPVTWEVILVLPALLLMLITSIWLTYLVGAICARFRDLINIFTAIMQLAFYITPVIWKPGFLEGSLRIVMQLNPFTYYLEIMRAPILGEPISIFVWGVAFAIAFTGLFISLIFVGKYRRQILYWI